MSWVDDNMDVIDEDNIQIYEAYNFALTQDIAYIAEVVLECKKEIDTKYKKMLIDICKKVLAGNRITEKQHKALCWGYAHLP